MTTRLGITKEGVAAAIAVKECYRAGEPLCVPGEECRLMTPENLMNHNLDLSSFEDPLPLAMVAARDPEPSMAMAAAARLSPLGQKTMLVGGVIGLVGETTRHGQVSQCVKMVTDNSFSPVAIAHVRSHASEIIVKTRRQYTAALRHNLQALLEGQIAPRQFVREFFDLAEAGNLRHDIRKKLLCSLMLSETVRPSIKFLILENFERMALPVRQGIIASVLQANPSRHLETIKEELRWITIQEKNAQKKQSFN